MRKTTLAASKVYWLLYARVSEDRSAKARNSPGESVPGQIRHLKELAAGGTILAVITEPKPISASEYSVRQRPGYKRLLKIMETKVREIRSREPDAVFILATREDTRISRRPVEREQLMETCRALGVLFNFAGTLYDPKNPDHVLTLRITGATAAHTSAMTAYKVQDKVNQRVADGRPHGKMPSIYKRRCDPETGKTLEWYLDPFTAPAVKKAIESIIAGKSGRGGHSVTAALKEFETTTGRKMDRSVFRDLLKRPTLAGIRTHKDLEVGKGDWPALITTEQHAQIISILTNSDRRTQSEAENKAKYLLPYNCYCGACGSFRMHTTWRGAGESKTRGLACSECYGVSIMAEPVEEMARAHIIQLLTEPSLLDVLEAADSDEESDTGVILSELHAFETRMDGFYEQAETGALSPKGLARMEAKLLPRIEDLKGRLATVVTPDQRVLAEYASAAAEKDWESWPMPIKRALVRAGLVITINKSGSARRRFDPSRVQIAWRIGS